MPARAATLPHAARIFGAGILLLAALLGAATAPHAPQLAQPAPALLNINTAAAPQLALLPEIGPALAARIVEYREQHGPFLSAQDLDAVKGIGPATIKKLTPLIRFE